MRFIYIVPFWVTALKDADENKVRWTSVSSSLNQFITDYIQFVTDYAVVCSYRLFVKYLCSVLYNMQSQISQSQSVSWSCVFQLHYYDILLSCFYASVLATAVAGGIVFLDCPSIGTSVHLSTALREFLQIWHKCPLGLKSELIRFWWSKVKVTVTWLAETYNHEVIVFCIFSQFSQVNNFTIKW